MNKIKTFDDVFKRHKIDLKKPIFSIPIVIEMMDDAIVDALKEWREECERLAGLVEFWQNKYYELNPPHQPLKLDNL